MLGLNLMRFRRALGLLAFYYAALHLTTYLVLDQDLDWGAIWAGIVGLVVLVPLALTSNNASIRRLGAQGWARLHKLVYLAVAAGAVHFVMLVKSWPLEPLVYALVLRETPLEPVPRQVAEVVVCFASLDAELRPPGLEEAVEPSLRDELQGEAAARE